MTSIALDTWYHCLSLSVYVSPFIPVKPHVTQKIELNVHWLKTEYIFSYDLRFPSRSWYDNMKPYWHLTKGAVILILEVLGIIQIIPTKLPRVKWVGILRHKRRKETCPPRDLSLKKINFKLHPTVVTSSISVPDLLQAIIKS